MIPDPTERSDGGRTERHREIARKLAERLFSHVPIIYSEPRAVEWIEAALARVDATGRAEEREACARIAEDHGHSNGRIRGYARHLAQMIRQRADAAPARGGATAMTPGQSAVYICIRCNWESRPIAPGESVAHQCVESAAPPGAPLVDAETREGMAALRAENERLRAVVEAAKALKCPRCHGAGKREVGCSLCGDSTYDHFCNDRTVTCETCKGTGHHPDLAAALGSLERGPAAPPGDAPR